MVNAKVGCLRSVIAILLFLTSSMVFSSDYKVVYVNGNVSIIDGSKKLNAEKGYILKGNESISTGEDSIAVVRSKKLILKIIENSKLSISDMNKKIVVDIQSGGVITNFIKDSVKNANRKELEVKTRHTTMGVRGTTFFAFNHKNQTSYLTVKEGEVDFKSKGSEVSQKVKDGKTTFTDTKLKGVKPKKVGFEDLINWELSNTSVDLRQPRELFAKLDAQWNEYKKENELKWKQNNDSMEEQWKQFKQQP